MEAYVYKAALYCAPCGRKICADLDAAGKRPPALDAPDGETGQHIPNENPESTYDSGDYPKGPYVDGGGEADSPQHCDACNAFLKNTLTEDGYAYLAGEISDAVALVLKGKRECIEPDSALGQWIDFYTVSCVIRTGFDAEGEIDASDLVREK